MAAAGCLVRVDVVDDFFDSIGQGLALQDRIDCLDAEKPGLQRLSSERRAQ
jgi:hypothetical protein